MSGIVIDLNGRILINYVFSDGLEFPGYWLIFTLKDAFLPIIGSTNPIIGSSSN